MLELKKGVDILSHAGGIESVDQARELFEEKLDGTHLERLSKINNEDLKKQQKVLQGNIFHHSAVSKQMIQ